MGRASRCSVLNPREVPLLHYPGEELGNPLAAEALPHLTELPAESGGSRLHRSQEVYRNPELAGMESLGTGMWTTYLVLFPDAEGGGVSMRMGRR